MIKQEFLQSLRKYTVDAVQQQALWEEIEKSYTRRDRHYHNLTHLNSMLAELEIHRDRFATWDVVIFAIAYHDAVYTSLKSNNEEKSAELAVKRLAAASFPKQLIARCEQFILATKNHQANDAEINLFTDADLSILGADPETYSEYSNQIRREYFIYPDLLYNPGRKKVLAHFREMSSIYKTTEFSNKYEANARRNIQAELERLTQS